MARPEGHPKVADRAGPGFELDRVVFDDGKVRVLGWWYGVRGRRFIRPSLTAIGAASRERALAELDHKPWAAEDGRQWRAEFTWEYPLQELEEFELAVAPDLAVRIPVPGAPRATNKAAEQGQSDDAAVENSPPAPLHLARAEQRLARALAERDAAMAERARLIEAHSQSVAERERLLEERDDAVTRAGGAVAERDRVVMEARRAEEERDQAQRERDAALRVRDSAAAEREVLSRQYRALVAERDELLEARDQARAERNRLLAQYARFRPERERLTHERDEAMAVKQRIAAERDRHLEAREAAISQRDTTLAELERVRRERDEAMAVRDRIAADRDRHLEERDQATYERETLTPKPERVERNAAPAEARQLVPEHEQSRVRRDAASSIMSRPGAGSGNAKRAQVALEADFAESSHNEGLLVKPEREGAEVRLQRARAHQWPPAAPKLHVSRVLARLLTLAAVLTAVALVIGVVLSR